MLLFYFANDPKVPRFAGEKIVNPRHQIRCSLGVANARARAIQSQLSIVAPAGIVPGASRRRSTLDSAISVAGSLWRPLAHPFFHFFDRFGAFAIFARLLARAAARDRLLAPPFRALFAGGETDDSAISNRLLTPPCPQTELNFSRAHVE
jgi:hypothetical protein